MQISAAGIQFIQHNEGLKLQIYGDVGHQAIGFGHDLTPTESASGEFSNGITEEQAVGLLNQDVLTVEGALNELIPATCTQNQFDALCDFEYNAGCGAGRKMLSHGWDQVTTQILRWNIARGVVNPNLVARRAAEVILFNTLELNP